MEQEARTEFEAVQELEATDEETPMVSEIEQVLDATEIREQADMLSIPGQDEDAEVADEVPLRTGREITCRSCGTKVHRDMLYGKSRCCLRCATRLLRAFQSWLSANAA